MASACGQTTSGTIRGRVLDPQGAAVPKVAVTVTGQGNGLVRTVTTDAEGTFVISNLPPGTVDPTTVAAGFADSARNGLVLEVGRTLSVDLNLTIGRARDGHRRSRRWCGYEPLGGRRRHPSRPHRGAAAQRPQLPRAGAARPGQCARAQLRPDQVELGRRSPRRASSVAAATSPSTAPTTTTMSSVDRCRTSPRSRCRSSRSRPTGSRPNRAARPPRSSTWSPARAPTSSAARPRSSCATTAGRALPATYDRRTATRALRSPAGGRRRRRAAGAARLFWFGAAEYRNQDGAVLVGDARRGGAHHPPVLRRRAARRHARLGARRLAPERRRWPDRPLRRRARRRYRRQHARSLDRLGLAAAAQREPLSVGRRHLDADLDARRSSTPPRLVQHVPQRHRPGRAGPQFTFPSMQDGTSFRVPQGTTRSASSCRLR